MTARGRRNSQFLAYLRQSMKFPQMIRIATGVLTA